MKRFSIFCAALFAAATSFAAVTYELNGGVTNEDNWLNKSDMWEGFKADAGITVGTLDELKAMGDPYTAICTPLGTAQAQAILDNAKWDWLEAYVMEVQNADVTTPATQLAAGTSSAGWRYALAAFFVEGQRTAWPKSADFSAAGKPEAFIPAWKHAFANPTEPTAEWVLNAPYKEGSTFDGWYAAADFSGEKVTVVNAETTGTLYAKWIEYVPTIAEVLAMEEGVETKVSGVVNWARNNNVFIQDATGGFLIYGSGLAPEVGTKIIAKGKRGSYNGSPQLSGAVIESSEAGVLFEPVVTTLADLVANPLANFGKRVSVLGVYVAEYDSYNNIYVADIDGSNKVKGHYMVVDPAQFPIGTKVSITAVASQYNGTFQFEGDVAGIEIPVVGKVDPYTYPVRHDKYELKNRWVISNVMENFAANAPGGDQKVRGMAAKDGIMYFINQNGTIVRVDGASGEMLSPITITGDHLFQVQNDSTGEWSSGVTYGFNDIKFDSKGNCLITGLPTSSAQRFMVYEVDLETGAATEVINERLADNPDFDGVTARFDAMGVNGDIHGNACVMAACAGGGLDVFRWLIIDGEAQPAELISMLIAKETDEYKWDITGWGTAPQIFPQDEVGSLFYVDGNTATPMLFDEGGMLVEDFIKCPAGLNVWNNPGDTTQLKADLCGLQEFQVGEEYFMIMIGTHTPSTPPQAFALYKFADEARSFDGLEPLWYFPADGLGSASNGVRTAVPTVEVEGNKATIYLYAQNNGYAVYEFTVAGVGSAVEDVESVKVETKKVVENGQVYIIKNGVKFNVLGAEVK